MEQAEIRLALLDLVCRTWGTLPPEQAVEKAAVLEAYVNLPSPKFSGWDVSDPSKPPVAIYDSHIGISRSGSGWSVR